MLLALALSASVILLAAFIAIYARVNSILSYLKDSVESAAGNTSKEFEKLTAQLSDQINQVKDNIKDTSEITNKLALAIKHVNDLENECKNYKRRIFNLEKQITSLENRDKYV